MSRLWASRRWKSLKQYRTNRMRGGSLCATRHLLLRTGNKTLPDGEKSDEEEDILTSASIAAAPAPLVPDHGE